MSCGQPAGQPADWCTAVYVCVRGGGTVSGLSNIRQRPRANVSRGLCSSSRRYLKLKRDEAAEKQDEETVDVTPVMISIFVVMCCSMLVLLYFFYDYLGMTNALTHPQTGSIKK